MKAPSELPPIDDAFQAHLRALKAHKSATTLAESRNNGEGSVGVGGGVVVAKCPDDGSSSKSSSQGTGGFSFHDSFHDTMSDGTRDSSTGGTPAAAATPGHGFGGFGSARGGGAGAAVEAAVGSGAVEVVTRNGDDSGHGRQTTSANSLRGALQAALGGAAATAAADTTAAGGEGGGEVSDGGSKAQGGTPMPPPPPLPSSSSLAFTVSAPATAPSQSVKPSDKSE